MLSKTMRRGLVVGAVLAVSSIVGCAPQGAPIATAFPALTSTTVPTSTPRLVHYVEVHPPVLDGVYLTNPGMGWQQDIKSENRDILPETVAYAVRRDLAWSVLNPAEGIYDWSALDAELTQAMSAGKQYSFRVQTMSGGVFGGARVPEWVLQAGAVILPSGEPDYSNCTFQDKWGEFVNSLAARYDGNPNIAYIDISGYGTFNEWADSDQTQTDPAWETAAATHAYAASAFQSLDGQARRRLADMFIGQSFQQHACRDHRNQVHRVDYAYSGFQHTQLIMPYSSILQSTQYVAWRRPDVGFRFDCLGGGNPDKIIAAAGDTWQRAPVVFELCPPDDFSLAVARSVLMQAHGSLVHDNFSALTFDDAKNLMLNVGYRYVLHSATVPETATPGDGLFIRMDWQNTGSAPAYPRMGQQFELHLYLIAADGQAALDGTAPVDVAAWMPAAVPGAVLPDNLVNLTMHLPDGLPAGVYQFEVAIIDLRTGQPVQLGFGQRDASGRYPVAPVQVGE